MSEKRKGAVAPTPEEATSKIAPFSIQEKRGDGSVARFNSLEQFAENLPDLLAALEEADAAIRSEMEKPCNLETMRAFTSDVSRFPFAYDLKINEVLYRGIGHASEDTLDWADKETDGGARRYLSFCFNLRPVFFSVMTELELSAETEPLEFERLGLKLDKRGHIDLTSVPADLVCEAPDGLPLGYVRDTSVDSGEIYPYQGVKHPQDVFNIIRGLCCIGLKDFLVSVIENAPIYSIQRKGSAKKEEANLAKTLEVTAAEISYREEGYKGSFSLATIYSREALLKAGGQAVRDLLFSVKTSGNGYCVSIESKGDYEPDIEVSAIGKKLDAWKEIPGANLAWLDRLRDVIGDILSMSKPHKWWTQGRTQTITLGQIVRGLYGESRSVTEAEEQLIIQTIDTFRNVDVKSTYGRPLSRNKRKAKSQHDYLSVSQYYFPCSQVEGSFTNASGNITDAAWTFFALPPLFEQSDGISHSQIVKYLKAPNGSTRQRVTQNQRDIYHELHRQIRMLRAGKGPQYIIIDEIAKLIYPFKWDAVDENGNQIMSATQKRDRRRKVKEDIVFCLKKIQEDSQLEKHPLYFSVYNHKDAMGNPGFKLEKVKPTEKDKANHRKPRTIFEPEVKETRKKSPGKAKK